MLTQGGYPSSDFSLLKQLENSSGAQICKIVREKINA